LKYAFLSDIHGNLPALEIVIEKSDDVDGYYILGDVVNYGPWSNECVQLINSLPNCTRILGNHEEYFINNKCNVNNNLVKTFFDKCFSDFSNIDLINKYQKESKFENFLCTHTIEGKYIFKDTNIDIKQNYIIGHSHQQYEIYRNGYRILNPGSVGQNRKYINEINFMIYDTTNKNADFRSVLYDIDVVIVEMEKMGYPKECLNYYKEKPLK